MATPSSEENKNATDSPSPEVLKPQSEDASHGIDMGQDVTRLKSPRRLHRGTYKPSHKATFIGLGVIAGILMINVGIVYFVMRTQASGGAEHAKQEVVLSSSSLDKLGVSRTAVGAVGTELIVGPNSRFNGKVTIGSDVMVGGQLKINGTFNAAEASFAKLQAGDTSLTQLNVNGDATVSGLNLRKDLSVSGLTRLQGPVTMNALLTVANNVNIVGNLAVGGTMSARSFQASTLVSDSTLIIGGHVITRGSAPSAARGSAVGPAGTVSISGNDSAGTVAANVGVGGTTGIIANVAFRSNYGTTPHVVISVVGPGAGSIYINRSVGGFSIGTNEPLSPGGYAFDYIVMQ